MLDFFSSWASGEVIALVAVLGGCVVAVTAIVTGHYQRLRQMELQSSLKHEMLSRGMSAEEITQVLRAPRKSASRCVD